MKVVKQENEFGLNIVVGDKSKYLAFTFAGNGDLYWSIHTRDNVNKSIVIDKENYELYRLFDQLFVDMDNVNIFNNSPFGGDRNTYIKYNISNYNNLYDRDNKVITWYSDEVNDCVSNILKIRKEEESFRVDFYTQEDKKGYDRDFKNSNYIPIRFRNSGSKYEPFNMMFMRMYNKMYRLDDVKDDNHQVHMEEYLYNNKKKVRKAI